MKSLIISAFAIALFFFQYVSTTGWIKTVSADSAAQAMTQPSDIAPTSGVMLVNSDGSNQMPEMYVGF